MRHTRLATNPCPWPGCLDLRWPDIECWLSLCTFSMVGGCRIGTRQVRGGQREAGAGRSQAATPAHTSAPRYRVASLGPHLSPHMSSPPAQTARAPGESQLWNVPCVLQGAHRRPPPGGSHHSRLTTLWSTGMTDKV